MKLCFDSIEEVKDFVGNLKGTRGKKGDPDDASQQPTTGQVPAPLLPPAGAQAGFAPGAGFAPPVGGAAPTGGAFPAAAATGPAPEVLAIVQRINARIDGAIASGQPAETARTWLAGQCGPDAANFTLDQLKTVSLPRLTMPALEQIAKLMNA